LLIAWIVLFDLATHDGRFTLWVEGGVAIGAVAVIAVWVLLVRRRERERSG